MTEEQLKRLHSAMLNDNEHQCNRLNNYIHTDEYLTAEVVKVVEEIVAETTKELQEQVEKMKCCCNCKHWKYVDSCKSHTCTKDGEKDKNYRSCIYLEKWEMKE